MNYLQKKSKKSKKEINMIFCNFQMFKKYLRRIFENIDKKCTAK